jgi:recombination protein RecR
MPMQYPEHILKLIAIFKKLPGVGTKSAERFAFHILDWPTEKLQEMAQTIEMTSFHLKNCEECGSLLETACSFCQVARGRNTEIVCVVGSCKDIYLIEQTHAFDGLYHVIGGLLSPLLGRSPSPIAIQKLKERIKKNSIKEMILALDPTLEGDATALYLKKEVETFNLKTSRLALGLPMGSSLDFIDGGTLARALAGRSNY